MSAYHIQPHHLTFPSSGSCGAGLEEGNRKKAGRGVPGMKLNCKTRMEMVVDQRISGIIVIFLVVDLGARSEKEENERDGDREREGGKMVVAISRHIHNYVRRHFYHCTISLPFSVRETQRGSILIIHTSRFQFAQYFLNEIIKTSNINICGRAFPSGIGLHVREKIRRREILGLINLQRGACLASRDSMQVSRCYARNAQTCCDAGVWQLG